MAGYISTAERTMLVALLIGALVLGFICARLNVLGSSIGKIIPQMGTLALLLLLFSMGISLGANPELVSSLASLGFKAIILSVGTISGSVFLVWITFRLRGNKS